MRKHQVNRVIANRPWGVKQRSAAALRLPFVILTFLFCLPVVVWAVPAGTVISNTANLRYDVGSAPVTTITLASNTVPITTVGNPASGGAIPGVLLTKTAGKSSVSIGEVLQYTLRLDNSSGSALTGVFITDKLPPGLRYKAGTAKRDGVSIADPTLSGSGRELRFTIGNVANSTKVELRYVAEVVPGAGGDTLVNTAQAGNGSGMISNQAEASVLLVDDFFNREAFLEGRVLVDSCDPNGANGLKNARIYLENGTYVLTDSDGRWHIEGVKPGSHVVQLDKASLPEEYEAVLCEDHTRHAGTEFSQFVDVKGGSLWRADFYVRTRPEQMFFAPLKRVHFDFDKDQVHTEDESLIQQIAQKVVGTDTAIYVDGHTDDVGSEGYNQDLSERRARSIAEKLQAYGVEEDQIDMQAFGFGQPAADNKLRDGRATNRRVDVSRNPAGYNVLAKQKQKVLRAAEQPEVNRFDARWLEQQDSEFAWVYPDTAFNPVTPSARIGVKHRADHKVKLLLNGEEVHPLNFDGTDKNSSGSVALSRWLGVNLKDNNNLAEAVLLDASGREVARISRSLHYSTEPVKAEFVQEKSTLIADGKQFPTIAIRLTDRDGYPARPGTTGYFSVNEPYRSEESMADQVEGRIIRASRDSQFFVGQNGIALLKLQPTTQSGEATLTVQMDAENEKDEVINAWLSPGKREWIFSGLAEAEVGELNNSGNDDGLAAVDLDDERYDQSRAAFFTKGSLNADWLLTAAYDTDKRDERFRQVIDPDTYYALYGDTTAQAYEAASTEKLFLKVEKQNFYTMFGDYDTTLDKSELAKYDRSITGLKSELKGKHWRTNFFAAETGQGYLRDELRGDGTSGLYKLSTKNITENTDKITIEVRDRFRNAEILSSEQMTRHIDYNIDYASGTLYFRKPVPDTDNRQNPIYIVAEYESESSDEEISGGGRAAYHLSEDTYVGVSAIHEGNVGAKGDLNGIDASVELTETLILKTEYATSDREQGNTDFDGDAYLMELTHDGAKLDATLYTREQEKGFGLKQQNSGESGVRSSGLDTRYQVNNEHSINSELYQEQDLDKDARRDVAEATYDYENGNNLAYVGGRYAKDQYDNGNTYQSSQLLAGGSTAVLDKRLTLSIDSELLLNGGQDESADYPNRVELGADYALTEAVDVLLGQEFSWSDTEDFQGSSAGLRLRPWTGMETITELGKQVGENGDRTYATTGMSQALKLDEHWRADFNVDRSQTISQSGTVAPTASFNEDDTEDFTAYSASLGYITDLREWSTRLENRHADTEEKTNLYMGYVQEIDRGLSMSLGMALSDADQDSGETLSKGDLRYSVAYRPNRSPWHHFNRLDYMWDETTSSSQDYRNRRWVNNLISNYKPDLINQLSLQYGGKYTLDDLDGDEYSGYSDLYGFEYRRNLPRMMKMNWDAGFHGHSLNQWEADIFQYSYGVSLGFSPDKNMWVSVGYNFAGFTDEDFSGSDYTAEGVYIKFRVKADQESLRDLWAKN